MAAAICVAGDRLAGPDPALGPGRPGDRAPPVLPRRRARAGGADPVPDRRRQPVLLLHARHGAARRARLRLSGRGAVLGDAGRRLRVRDPPARAVRRHAASTSARSSCCPRCTRSSPSPGAGARRLLDRQAEAEDALGEQERMLAAQAERERLARDMHDSLAKTVHGIGFSALALSRRIERRPARAPSTTPSSWPRTPARRPRRRASC